MSPDLNYIVPGPVPPDNDALKASAAALAAIQVLAKKQLEIVERQEQANVQKEKANDKAARRSMLLTLLSLGIATVSFMGTAWASWADWRGDAVWQSEQVTELQAANEQLEKMLELQVEVRAEQQRQIEELLKAISAQNSEGSNADSAAGQSSNPESRQVVENQ